MRKRLGVLALLFFLVSVVSGCATIYPVGALYSGVKLPCMMGDGKDITYTKVGTAKCTSVLTLVATGDASIEAAARAGGIKTIKYVDYHVDNILGVIGTYTTTVYGD